MKTSQIITSETVTEIHVFNDITPGVYDRIRIRRDHLGGTIERSITQESVKPADTNAAHRSPDVNVLFKAAENYRDDLPNP